eukprot:15652964-Heterocapsa_arctica.AAC.1
MRRLAAARRRAFLVYHAKLGNFVRQFFLANDMSTCWQFAILQAGKQMGSTSRGFCATVENHSPLLNWSKHLAQDGPHGGMSTHQVWKRNA